MPKITTLIVRIGQQPIAFSPADITALPEIKDAVLDTEKATYTLEFTTKITPAAGVTTDAEIIIVEWKNGDNTYKAVSGTLSFDEKGAKMTDIQPVNYMINLLGSIAIGPEGGADVAKINVLAGNHLPGQTPNDWVIQSTKDSKGNNSFINVSKVITWLGQRDASATGTVVLPDVPKENSKETQSMPDFLVEFKEFSCNVTKSLFTLDLATQAGASLELGPLKLSEIGVFISNDPTAIKRKLGQSQPAIVKQLPAAAGTAGQQGGATPTPKKANATGA